MELVSVGPVLLPDFKKKKNLFLSRANNNARWAAGKIGWRWFEPFGGRVICTEAITISPVRRNATTIHVF
jgi:hypothetical protein